MTIKENNGPEGKLSEDAPARGAKTSGARRKPWRRPEIAVLDIRQTGSGKHLSYEHGEHRPTTPVS